MCFFLFFCVFKKRNYYNYYTTDGNIATIIKRYFTNKTKHPNFTVN